MRSPSRVPSPACPSARRVRALIERHFTGEADEKGERAMRAHIVQCEDCRQTYERHLLLSELDPRAPNAKERIARGLGLHPRQPSLFARRQVWVIASAVAAAVPVVLFFGLQTRQPDTDFHARGPTASNQPALLVYQIQAPGKPVLVDGAISRSDELAFAYRNPQGHKRVMVFALDTRNKVYWYHPAWSDPSKDPTAVPIQTTEGTHELREAIRHELFGETLEIIALFTDARLHVKEVEKLLGPHGNTSALQRLPDATLARQTLRVLIENPRGLRTSDE